MSPRASLPLSLALLGLAGCTFLGGDTELLTSDHSLHGDAGSPSAAGASGQASFAGSAGAAGGAGSAGAGQSGKGGSAGLGGAGSGGAGQAGSGPAGAGGAGQAGAGQAGAGQAGAGQAGAGQAGSGGAGSGGAGAGQAGAGASGGGGGQVCLPGEEVPCYEGPEGTKGTGACKGGAKKCLPGGDGFGPCLGQVLPSPEVCGNEQDDDDCDGVPRCVFYVLPKDGKLRRLRLDGSNEQVVGDSVGGFTALTYYSKQDRLFFTRWEEQDRVRSVRFDGTDLKSVYSELNSNGGQGIAIDEASGKLFWGVYYSGLRAGTVAGDEPSTLVPSSTLTDGAHGVGTGLALDPASQSVFFNTRKNNSGNWIGRKIWRVGYDGSSPGAIVQLKNSDALAIGVDKSGASKLYFSDTRPDETSPYGIYRSGLDGQSVETIVDPATTGNLQVRTLAYADGALFVMYFDPTVAESRLARVPLDALPVSLLKLPTLGAWKDSGTFTFAPPSQ